MAPLIVAINTTIIAVSPSPEIIIDNKAPFRYQDDYWPRSGDASIFKSAAVVDTRFAIIDSFALEKTAFCQSLPAEAVAINWLIPSAEKMGYAAGDVGDLSAG